MSLLKSLSENEFDQDRSLAIAEELLEEAGLILGRLLKAARMQSPEEPATAKALKDAIRDLSAGWQLAVKERNRVAEERKRSCGIAGEFAIDFAQARAEVERRLACLRDAGDDHGVS